MSFSSENIAGLLAILKYARPHDSKAEIEFCNRLFMQLKALGAKPDIDGFGNIWASIDTPYSGPSFLFSCHVDTMDSGQEEKGLSISSAGLITLKKRKPGRCLGADDGAGLWLMLQMITARIPGRYAFHRGEEVGRLGSSYVSRVEPDRLAGIDAAIAFDRRGTTNLITHQMSERGCSESFANAFCKAVNNASNGALRYAPDDTGSYTDSYSYFQDIPECCNVSVGYYSEHGPNESLDFAHLSKLRAAIVKADFSRLPIERDPSIQEMDWYGSSYGGYSFGGSKDYGRYDDTLESLCADYPETAARLLEAFGVSELEFLEELQANGAQLSSYMARYPMK